MPFTIEVKTMEDTSSALTEWTVDEVFKRIRKSLKVSSIYVANTYWSGIHRGLYCQCYCLVLRSDLPNVLSDMLLFNTIIITFTSLTWRKFAGRTELIRSLLFLVYLPACENVQAYIWNDTSNLSFSFCLYGLLQWVMVSLVFHPLI